tara:strand:- start:2107 stop:2298 length:192 start_codon:yes stop_codon:yes gene_type:complete
VNTETSDRWSVDYLAMSELWRDGEYNTVGEHITTWPAKKIVEFCGYFAKYIGSRDLAVLYKFL